MDTGEAGLLIKLQDQGYQQPGGQTIDEYAMTHIS